MLMLSGYTCTQAAGFVFDWFSNKECLWKQLPSAVYKEHCQ